MSSKFVSAALRVAWVAAVVAALGACSLNEKVDEFSRIDYKSSGKVPPLDIPPDLASPRGDGRFDMPSGRDTARTASERSVAAPTPSAGQPLVLPPVQGVRMERSGTERWLVTSLTPDQLWPLLREFWQESGFIVETESPQTGIVETDWAENRAKLPLDVIRRTLGKVFDSVYSTGERDKFRTRIDRGPEGTEIHITHRGMVEVYSNTDKDQTIWQPRPNDPELEVEFLRRLMVKLGATTDAAAQAAAAPTPASASVRLVDQGGSKQLQIDQDFDRAWRQLGLALDRGGFTVDDRDRSQGLYFVRYIDPEAQARRANSKPGFLGRIFGGKPQEEISQQFRLKAESDSSGTVVSVLDRNGETPTGIDADTASKILALLQEELK